ncbi:Clavaminate synthase-like protein [Annulohypoxylon bovei var. microspora]|nr:Clavaminate synthase-like protein [Annulohypoxylon bovei var. microspora]
MKPVIYFSRGLLGSQNHHVGSSTHSLSRGLSRTSIILGRFPTHTFRQFSAVKRRSVLWPNGCKVTTQIIGKNKRGLTSWPEPTEPTEAPSDDSSPIDLKSEKMVRVQRPFTALNNIFPRHWLRDSCTCSICVDPDSGQKNFGSCDVPTDLPIVKASLIEDGGLDITWGNDFLSGGNHESRYLASQLTPGSKPRSSNKLPNFTLWDKETFERDRLTIDYDEWMAGEDAFLSGLHRLFTHGLVFLRNVPSSGESVVSIANQIGHIQETFYGRTWDVRSKPNAENVAYTSSFLGLHQDLLYLNNSPRIQLLHCLENTCEGGDSLFSDGERACHLTKTGPDSMVHHLSSRNIRYAYYKYGQHYETSRSIISPRRSTIFWSPPFQSSDQPMHPTVNNHQAYQCWLYAANLFRHLLEDEPWVYQYKMKPGECVLFDNLRVLHGRKQFDTATGSRLLKGTYISTDVFISKVKSLAPQLMAIGAGNETSCPQQALNFNHKHLVWDKLLYEENPSVVRMMGRNQWTMATRSTRYKGGY